MTQQVPTPPANLTSSPDETPSSATTPNAEQIHAYFSPYQRVSPPWNIYERVKTVLMTVFILPFRVLYLILSGAILLLIATIAMIGWPPSDPAKEMDHDATDMDADPRFKALPKWRRMCLSLIFPIVRSILFVCMGVYNIRHDKQPLSDPSREGRGEAYVIVANHLGYIDILVLLAMFKGSFVAKGELEHAAIVGPLARALQCMFVRKGQSLTSQLIARVQSTYACHRKRQDCPGCPSCMSKLVIFPEGTTTNGTAMVPFRTGVFNAGLPVKPICIRFPYRRFNLSWETIRFREHLFRTMTQVRNRVHVTELPVYQPNEEEMNDVRLFAKNVQTEMAKVLEQEVVPLNRKHKFLYHGWILGKEKAESVLKKADELFQEDEQLVYLAEKEGEEAV